MTSLLLTTVIFVFKSSVTRIWAISILFAIAFSWLVDKLVAKCYAYCLVRDMQVLRPNAFIFVDFLLTVIYIFFIGIPKGFVRFFLGVLHILVQMTDLSRPLLPAFASFDSGFVAYGSMLKAASVGVSPRLETRAESGLN